MIRPLQVVRDVHSQQLKCSTVLPLSVTDCGKSLWIGAISISLVFFGHSRSCQPQSPAIRVRQRLTACCWPPTCLISRSSSCRRQTCESGNPAARSQSGWQMSMVPGRYRPCGMPADSCSQSVRISPSFTRWRSCDRKEQIHRTVTSGSPSAISLDTRTL